MVVIVSSGCPRGRDRPAAELGTHPFVLAHVVEEPHDEVARVEERLHGRNQDRGQPRGRDLCLKNQEFIIEAWKINWDSLVR